MKKKKRLSKKTKRKIRRSFRIEQMFRSLWTTFIILLTRFKKNNYLPQMKIRVVEKTKRRTRSRRRKSKKRMYRKNPRSSKLKPKR